VNGPPPVTGTGPADLEAAGWMRRDMGRDFAARRRGAGLTQQKFGTRGGFTRSYVSHAENGQQHVSREFWEAADRMLGTGTHFTAWYDRINGTREPEPEHPAVQLLTAAGLRAANPAEALAWYRKLGWPASEEPGGLALETGQAADALEVPCTAGLLGARWWLETGGQQDLVRGLPQLPSPVTYMAAVDAGDRWYFLVRAGSSPWPAQCAREVAHGMASRTPAAPDGPAISWHAVGSRIPLPPATAGQQAAWAFLPSPVLRLPPPLAVLHLLSRAAAVARNPSALAMPGGTLVTPATAIQAGQPDQRQ
jgi:transcriptional regulator with XRE-family HTH domain